MNNYLYVGVFIISLIFLGSIIFYEASRFNNTHTEKFSFFAYFPFEINIFRRNKVSSILSPIFYGIGVSGLSFCSFLFAFATQKYGGSVTAAYIIFALNVLVAISFLILRFIKLSNYKLHIGFASVNVALNLLIDFIYLFFFTNSHVVFLRTPNIGVEIACFIIILALLVFIFVLLLNPSYKQWIKMVKIDAETFSRPKKNYLVIIERGCLLHYLLTIIPLSIAAFF